MRRDVVVVGGGPAGAATATALARRGLDVLVLDRARFPRPKPCGEFLSPAAHPLLEDLGVVDAVEAAGARRLGRVRIVVHGEAVELAFPDLGDAPAWGYALSRERLDAILIGAARSAGAEVREDTRVEGPLLDGGRVRGVAVRNGDGRREIAARIVVGAGGRNDPVARALGLQRRASRRRYDLLAHWAPPDRNGGAGRAPVAAPGPDEAEPTCELRVAGDRYLAAAPVEGGRTNVNGVVPMAALRARPDPEALYDALLAADPGMARWTGGRRREAVVASDVTALATPTAVADGALLVGDAALFLDPFTGQGLYLALHGGALAARTIADALAGGRADRDALLPYDTARSGAFEAKRKTSAALQRVLFRPRLSRRVAAAIRSDGDLSATVAAVTGDLAPAERMWCLPFAIRLAARALVVGRA